MTNLESATPTNVIHPRRLFTMPEEDKVQINVTPKRTVTAHGLPLLAPSPTSGIYIDAALVVADVESLCEYLKSLGENFSDGFLNSKGNTVPAVTTKQLAPLRDVIGQLQSRIYEQSTMAIITPLLTPPEPVTPAIAEEEDEDKSVPLVASPIKSAVCDQSVSRVMDSRMLSSDLEHLRTIQKEVRGLFRASNDSSVRSPSPISTRRGGGVVLESTSSSSMVSRGTSEGAGKISRLLTESEEIKKQESLIDAGLSQLTLSPATELLERDSIRRNPWFAGGRSLVPPESPMLRGRDVKSTGVAAALNAAMGQTRTARSQSRRRSVSASAPANSRQERKASDLISWLKKQATSGSPGYSGGSAKKLASIYTSRHRGDSGDGNLNRTTVRTVLKSAGIDTDYGWADSYSERIFSTNEGVESMEHGMYIVRGDNVASIGEIDDDIDTAVNWDEIRAEPLNTIRY